YDGADIRTFRQAARDAVDVERLGGSKKQRFDHAHELRVFGGVPREADDILGAFIRLFVHFRLFRFVGCHIDTAFGFAQGRLVVHSSVFSGLPAGPDGCWSGACSRRRTKTGPKAPDCRISMRPSLASTNAALNVLATAERRSAGLISS